jgi:hypothetical protein
MKAFTDFDLEAIVVIAKLVFTARHNFDALYTQSYSIAQKDQAEMQLHWKANRSTSSQFHIMRFYKL